MIGLVDYGLGNIQAFANIYQQLGLEIRMVSTPSDLAQAHKLILPGVGSFDWAMTLLNKSGLRAALDELVLEQQMPVLGVCVGMQMMARRSEEGKLPGLGWINAEVVKFEVAQDDDYVRLPHMGWNDVVPVHGSQLFQGIELPRYYFLHSYYIQPADPAVTLATATYVHTFTAAVCSGHIYGTQFHPEKSHEWGISLLKNFAEL